jgi:CRP-like cAMP-binding protein
MISVVAIMENGSSIEVSTIGRAGLVGGFLLLGIDRLPYRYFAQVAGRAQRMEAVRLQQEADRNPEFCKAILRYQAALLSQSMQLTAGNGLHTIQQQCCRWLLMARDRSDSDKIVLTHEFLALMLGVRRASVSEVLRPLQKDGLIRSARGRITHLNRKTLEAGSCECDQTIREQYRRATG